MRPSLVPLAGIALALASLPLWAQSSVASAKSAGLDASAATNSIAPPSLWSVSTTLRASIGWRDNILLSSVQRLSRSYWRGAGDVFVLRPLGSHADLIGFLSGDVLRYFSPSLGVDGEQDWAAELQGRWHPASFVSTTLKGVGFLDDMFIDPSLTEGTPEPVIGVRAEGGYVMLAPQFKILRGLTLEPSLQEKRIRFARFGPYAAYPGAHTESRPGIRLEWKRSDRLVLSAAWYAPTRHYSELTQSAMRGRPLPGRWLTLHQREAELKASTRIEARGTWTVAATAGWLENRDRAFGFLDYDERRAAFETHWNRGAWRTLISAEAKRYDYLVQTVGTGIAVTPRVTDAFEVLGRVERDFGRKWMLFAETRWERNRSNVADFKNFHPFSYRTDTAQIGLQRSL